MFIYLLRHKRTGKEYVGKTVVSLRSRLYEHKARAKSGAPYPLSEAIRQDGVESFEMILLATARSHDELWTLEQQFIADRNTIHPHGYNLVRGGRGNYGWKMPAETRAKVAASRRGRSAWNKGVKASQETRRAMSLARKGQDTPARQAARAKMMTTEVRARISASKRGVPLKPAHRSRMSAIARCIQAAMSPEAKQIRNKKVADRKRAWWASLSPSAREAHIDKMKAGHSAAP